MIGSMPSELNGLKEMNARSGLGWGIAEIPVPTHKRRKNFSCALYSNMI
jgi:hypothetical protein